MEAIGGFVVEVVVAGEPGTAYARWVFGEGNPQIVYDGMINVKTAKTSAFDMSIYSVDYLQEELIACLMVLSKVDLEVTAIVGEILCFLIAKLHAHIVHVGHKVETDGIGGN